MRELTPETFAETFGPVPQLPHDVSAYTSGHDLAALLCLARGARGIIEFGTARGQTTLALARACPHARIVTIDVDADLVPEGAYQRCDLRPQAEIGAAFHGKPEAARITQLILDPRLDYDLAVLAALGPFDFAFVDGLHTYEGVAKDSAAALALVCSGIIVWDDCHAAGVPVFLHGLQGLTYLEGTRLAWLDRRADFAAGGAGGVDSTS